MKKIISLLLAIVLMMSLAIPAFATTVENSSEVILTTVVPEVSFTLNIPAEANIPYGEVEYEIANPTITNVQRFKEGDGVVLTTYCTGIGLFSEDKTQVLHSIPMSLLYRRTTPDGQLIEERFATQNDNILLYVHGDDATVLKYYSYIETENWEAALPGAYIGSVRFDARYVPAA